MLHKCIRTIQVRLCRFKIFKMHPNWRALCTENLRWKQFVREGAQKSNENELNGKDARTIGDITGEEAKTFYEDVLQSSSRGNLVMSSNVDKESLPKEASLSTVSNGKKSFCNKEKWLNAFLKEAQNNNVKEVEELLHFASSNINEQDYYGWTALMTACCAGAVDVVRLLLTYGADIHLKDRGGNSCLSLAKSMGQKEVLNILSNRNLFKQNQMESLSTEGKNVQFYCKVCKMDFKDTTEQQHNTSTVHLFNLKPKPCTSNSYGIPCTNKGYQILVKSGWNENNGLGPEGSGRKFPLKTVLKRDRRGLGGNDSKREKPRVTHFGPKEIEAVRRVPRTKTSHQRRTELHRAHCKERAWRREFADI